MKILLFTDSYPPEIRSAAILMQELAQGLAGRGHAVWVCTLKPRYNLAGAASRCQGQIHSFSRENGVRILRLGSLPVHNTWLWLRGLGELALPWSFLARSLSLADFDVVGIYSPPLSLGLAGAGLQLLRQTPFIINVQDLFPQNAIDAGLLKNRPLIRLFSRMERFVYCRAQAIAVHSEGNRQFLMKERGVRPEKIAVIPNWVDPAQFGKRRFPGFKKAWGLEGKFVLMFGGVLGHTQGLEIVVDAAQKLRRLHDLVFLLVGNGAARGRLQQEVKRRRLPNVVFKPFLEPDLYRALLGEVDACFLTLSPEVKTPVVPSKLLGYMAAGKPYIAALNPESDAVAITRDSGAGLVVPAGDPQSFAQAVQELYTSRTLARQMGRQGRAYVRAHFSKEACLDRYEALLRACAAGRPSPEESPGSLKQTNLAELSQMLIRY